MYTETYKTSCAVRKTAKAALSMLEPRYKATSLASDLARRLSYALADADLQGEADVVSYLLAQIEAKLTTLDAPYREAQQAYWLADEAFEKQSAVLEFQDAYSIND